MSEPILWMDEESNFFHKQVGYYTIPLYAHPVDLTDEEIDNLIADVAEKPTDEDLYDFARAILRKVKNDQK